MNKTKKVIFSILFVLSLAITGIAFAENPDIYMQDVVSTKEEAEEVKAKHFSLMEIEYVPNLKECTFIDYKTEIEELVDNLNEVTKETNEEMKSFVNEKEKEGYVVTVESKEHDGVTNVYELTALNGIVTNSTKNNKNYPSFVGKNLVDILTNTTNINNADVRIVYTTNSSSTSVKEEATVKSEKEAQDLVKKFVEKGYEASYTQNNNDVVNVTLTSRTSLTKEDIETKLQNENQEKEVKDVIITNITEPNTYTSEKYNNKSDAENKYNELNATNIYESLELKTVINENSATKIANKVPFVWTKNDITPYTEDIYTNGIKTGYKYYYAIDEVIEKAESKKQTGLTKTECNTLLNSHTSQDGWTSECTKVTNITKSETVNNVIKFNDTKQRQRTWRHLDISVAQKISVIGTNGNIVASNISGTLSNTHVVLNEGTSNEKTITYAKPTYDNGRLEIRQDTKSNYTKVTNEDKVKIYTTLSYTYNNTAVSKQIVLEGYLDNIFNVCRERNKIGGGFDLEFDILVDVEGNVYIVISTEETYTFTATKPAITQLQGYYDEYEFQKQYQVIAKDEDYTYDVTYVVTDYDVVAIGTKNFTTITETIYDKYYVVNGTKTTYQVTTIGNIVRDNSCKTEEDYGKLIVNYVTTDGTKLIDQQNYKELGNTPYETVKKSFDGYRLVKVDGNTSGVYIANQTIEVTYVYEKLPTIYTGVNGSNEYSILLILSSVSLLLLLVFKKKISE